MCISKPVSCTQSETSILVSDWLQLTSLDCVALKLASINISLGTTRAKQIIPRNFAHKKMVQDKFLALKWYLREQIKHDPICFIIII